MARERITAVLEARDNATPKFTRLTKAVTALGAAAVFVGAVQIGRVLVRGISKAVEASAKQEAAEVKLAQALRLTGQSVSETLPSAASTTVSKISVPNTAPFQQITGFEDINSWQWFLRLQRFVTMPGGWEGWIKS